jgi:hypothetical protein
MAWQSVVLIQYSAAQGLSAASIRLISGSGASIRLIAGCHYFSDLGRSRDKDSYPCYDHFMNLFLAS